MNLLYKIKIILVRGTTNEFIIQDQNNLSKGYDK